VLQHAESLGEMLASLQAQTVTEWECALVIDGPDPAIERIARSVASADDRITVHVLPEWVGLPGARNACAARTTAPWPIVYGPAREWYLDGRTSVWRYPPFNAATFADYHQMPGSALMPRALFDALGGFNATLTKGGDDWEFRARAVARGWLHPIQIAESRWWYRHHDGPRVSREGMKRMHVLQPMLRAILAGT